tara:strand:- start:29148 stop:29804 length:657 start_codon:yes stop_codon:yes gene_type:complete
MDERVACFIPIKRRSTRVPQKNFRLLNGKKLYRHIIDTVVASKAFTDIFVDTDSKEIMTYCKDQNINIIEREPTLSQDNANGNDLLNYWYELYPEYDFYFQAFATSPFTRIETVVESVNLLKVDKSIDSIFTVHEKCGWYWFEGRPINYDPKTLPRSQDAKKVFSESTALYGITNKALKIHQCRIGEKPYYYFVDDVEAIDLDSEFDFKMAEAITRNN